MCVCVDTEVDDVVTLDVVELLVVRVSVVELFVVELLDVELLNDVELLYVVELLVVQLVVVVIDEVKDKHCDISSCKDSISVTSCPNSSGSCTMPFPLASERHAFATRRFSWKSLRHVSSTFTSSSSREKPSLHASSHLPTAACSLVLPKQ